MYGGIFMKHIRRSVLCVFCLLALTLPIFAASGSTVYTLSVNGTIVDVRSLPKPVYTQNGTVMIPFRKTAEALGYAVTWNDREHCAQAEDRIQSASVCGGSAVVRWTGKLAVIDLTRQTALKEKAVIAQGVTYVPAQLFEEFFNDVVIRDGVVSISPQMAYLN